MKLAHGIWQALLQARRPPPVQAEPQTDQEREIEARLSQYLGLNA
jgi:hypothetical protein